MLLKWLDLAFSLLMSNLVSLYQLISGKLDKSLDRVGVTMISSGRVPVYDVIADLFYGRCVPLEEDLVQR